MMENKARKYYIDWSYIMAEKPLKRNVKFRILKDLEKDDLSLDDAVKSLKPFE